MIDSNTNWDGDNAKQFIVAAAWERMVIAAAFLLAQLKQTLGKTGPSSRRSYKLHGKNYSEKVYTPSAAGSPPFKRTGNLQQAVQMEMDEESQTIRVGLMPNALYGIALELGSAGGRVIAATTGKALRFFSAAAGKFIWRKQVKQGAIAARPWFMVTLRRVWSQMQALMGVDPPKDTVGGGSGDRVA